MEKPRVRQFLMVDRTNVTTEMIPDEHGGIIDDDEGRLNLFMKRFLEKGDMLVGFGTEWTYSLPVFISTKIFKSCKNNTGLEVRNSLDLSELAAQVLHQPLLKLHGVRELANKVLSKNLQPRQWSNIVGDSWYEPSEDCTRGQIECATVDAYATYKIANKLLNGREN
ncbi:hypothetical protein EZV62_007392 [Acer yangbiense]|uniref:3'-5' exonuclease domain-containing protein n=1 Tax=Acer yangbiense TaxID=1000413 RepID=A0A5C7IAB4_9ROSI|nr:hypothetical protein EZV62_007392 [Acer yangbiense]